MALFVTFACFIILSTSFTTIHGLFSEQSPLSLSAIRMEKLTRLHFYFHDIQGGQNPTALRILGPPNKSVGSFGTTFITDDPLTEKPEASSKLVGRAQGIYAFASQHDSGLLMVLNFAFIEGMYNGSTLSILGRNPFMDTMREMPIVGGSGAFRYARGYALARTFSFNPKTGDAVVQYNVSVLHY
ncbi:dirigent protein 22-like [Rosa rugosa]|uniref:dirigent protein 22-like n=1 Tax=Rosa rugosa TaxID=74645 RepID=UPI002B4061B9|nr:dirigent protein 22-like [Rosa rugosa]